MDTTEAEFRAALRAGIEQEGRDFLANWLTNVAAEVRAGTTRFVGIDAFTEIADKPGWYALALRFEAEKVALQEQP